MILNIIMRCFFYYETNCQDFNRLDCIRLVLLFWKKCQHFGLADTDHDIHWAITLTEIEFWIMPYPVDLNVK